MKKLSFNMLRGLFADIINDTAKTDLYFFNKYKILVISRCEEKDIKRLEKIIANKEGGNISSYQQLRHIQTNRCHRRIYIERKKNKQCIKCGKDELETIRSGKEGIMCKKCGSRKRKLDMRRYYNN